MEGTAGAGGRSLAQPRSLFFDEPPEYAGEAVFLYGVRPLGGEALSRFLHSRFPSKESKPSFTLGFVYMVVILQPVVLFTSGIIVAIVLQSRF